MSALACLGTAAAMAVLVMLGLWLLHLRLRNAGIVDVGWAYTVVLCALLFGFLGPGEPLRRHLGMAMTAVWGLRLGTYLLFRVAGHAEDARYTTLRESWGPRAPLLMLGFFELQALVALLYALPAFLVAFDPLPCPAAFTWIGAGLWALGVVGEALADKQLADFKRDPANRGQVCRAGLWNYSRHPNYFFESCVWVGMALFASPAPWGWLAFLCPALMLFFLFKVTGIPATEAQALRSKGAAYAAYQRSTSRFIPWFPRHD